MSTSLQARFLVPVSTFIALVVLGGALTFSIAERNRIISEIGVETTQQMDAIKNLLEISDSFAFDQVKSAMRLFKERGTDLGEASYGAKLFTKPYQVKDVVLGKRPQGSSTDLVDSVSLTSGGTATVFSKYGDKFVRISTSAKTSIGNRAIGTELDSKGPAAIALNKGSSFYGQTDVMGRPYLSAYEPIYDKQRQVIGAWSVGYPADIKTLASIVAQSRLLTKGFLAVVDDHGLVMYHSDNIDTNGAQQILTNADGWVVTEQSFTDWGFRIISAYNLDEVNSIATSRRSAILSIGLLAWAVIVTTIFIMLRKLVTNPIGGDPTLAAQLMTKIASGDLTVTIPVADGDKRSLLSSMSRMQRGVRRIADSVSMSAKQLADSSEHLSNVSSTLAVGLNRNSRITVSVPIENLLVNTDIRSSISHDDLVKSVESVSRLNEENAESAKSIADDAYRLQTLASGLRLLVGGFKL